jgi:nicotinamide-nucleotide amidase
MKNACIVFNNSKNTCENAYLELLSAFRDVGFTVTETRVLTDVEPQYAEETLSQIKKDYDSVLILTDKNALSTVKAYVSSVFKGIVSTHTGAEVLVDKDKTVFVLSADRSETGLGFVKTAEHYLTQKSGARIGKCVFRTIGAGDERVLSLIAEAKRFDQGAVTYRRTRSYGEDVVEMLYGENAPKMLVDDLMRLFVDGLGDSLYALDDTSLAEQLVRLLKVRGKRLSVAESFTGGRIAKAITSVSGASAVYFEGLNTYDERSKQKRLGVSEYTLRTVGAVSDQTAYEMATGLLSTGDCDIAIATTGLAGPNTDKSGLPVGLCYIAVGTQEKVFVYRYKFEGGREDICAQGVNYAMYHAYKLLKNM